MLTLSEVCANSVKKLHRTAIVATVSVILVACSSTTSGVKTTKKKEAEVVPVQEEIITYDENFEVISSIQQLIDARQYSHARSMSAKLADLDNPPSQTTIDWLTASSYFAENDLRHALKAARTVSWTKLPTYLQPEYLRVMADYYADSNPVKSAALLIEGISIQKTDVSQQQVDEIWQRLNQDNRFNLSEFNRITVADTRVWVELLSASRMYGLDSQQFSLAIDAWQRSFATNPIMPMLLETVQPALISAQVQPQRIAVLLPMTGQRKALGLAIRDGIVTASMQQDSKHIEFIDTHKIDWTMLEVILADKEIDFVVGPLLKKNISAYQANVKEQPPTLLLNSDETMVNLSAATYQFSLNPEAEIEQAVSSLMHKGFITPIVIAPENETGRRLAKTFIKRWDALKVDQNSPQVSYFSDSKSMEKKVRNQLDVDKSMERIKAVKRLIPVKSEAEPRNRRDVDMVYVIATPIQSRLVKPFIDVNTSPFAEGIPVYASSRSYTYSENGNEVRDLTGMTFTDMPWVINATATDPEYHQLQRDVWPNRDTNQFRLFAMGYDAYSLLNHLDNMKHIQQLSYKGLTGEIKSDDNGVLSRKLSWGRINRSKVQAIAME